MAMGCSGIEGYTYPYGWNVEEQKCNSDTRTVEPSGSRHNCVSKFGGYDMTGNIFEWVTGDNAQPMLMGGLTPNARPSLLVLADRQSPRLV